MYLGRLILAFSIGFCSHLAVAQAAPKAVPQSTAKPRVKSLNRFGVGLGLMMFTENLKVIQAGARDTGVANYSGLVFYAEHTWTKSRWIYQAALGIGVGKATASLSAASYDDGNKRSWNLAYGEGSASYRITPRVSLGAGLIAGTRSADWKSETNTALTVQELNKTVYAPEFVMRWNASRRFTLVQSISTPDFRGSTMWRWTGQFNL